MEEDKPFVSGYSFDTDRNHYELPNWPPAVGDRGTVTQLVQEAVLSTPRGQDDIVDSGAEGWRDDYCPKCGAPVPVGAWPFCASPANPQGHSKGVTYRWKTKFSMKLQGWTRRER